MIEKSEGSSEIGTIEEAGVSSMLLKEGVGWGGSRLPGPDTVMTPLSSGGARGAIPKVSTHKFEEGRYSFHEMGEALTNAQERLNEAVAKGTFGKEETDEGEEVEGEEVVVESEKDKERVIQAAGEKVDLALQPEAEDPRQESEHLKRQKRDAMKYLWSVWAQSSAQQMSEAIKGLIDGVKEIDEAVEPAQLPDMSPGAL